MNSSDPCLLFCKQSDNFPGSLSFFTADFLKVSFSFFLRILSSAFVIKFSISWFAFLGSLVSQFSNKPLIVISTDFKTSWVVNLSFVWPEKVGLFIKIEI